MTSTRPGGEPSALPATPSPKPPTGRDVARRAGVSQATVSLVLGGKEHGRVAPRTAGAVRAAARALGYRPNLAARSLRLGRTRTALLVVPVLDSDFFAGVHTGAAGVAAEHDTGLVLYRSPGTGRAADPFVSAGATLDGIIASSMAPGVLAELHADGLPLVMLDSDPDGSQDATVNCDIAGGMRAVAAHLAGLGHRRFAHLPADVDSWTFHVRRHALVGALGSASVVVTEPSGISVQDGLRAATRVLTTTARPTALVCDDDLIAAGACKAARRLGLRVPEDVSVTGFGDLPLAGALEPELTTVRLPAEAIGAAGLHALLTVLGGTPATAGTLPARLVPRGSSGPAAA